MFPKSLTPCNAAGSSTVPLAGTPSASPVTSPGRLKITQCTNGRSIGASGSSQISAIDFVPAGAADQLNAGLTSSPSPVNFRGIA